jgi:hypothetical protein
VQLIRAIEEISRAKRIQQLKKAHTKFLDAFKALVRIIRAIEEISRAKRIQQL